jgi:hypothetical protein
MPSKKATAHSAVTVTSPAMTKPAKATMSNARKVSTTDMTIRRSSRSATAPLASDTSSHGT